MPCFCFMQNKALGMASMLIKHSALPRALLATQLCTSGCISCKALTAMLLTYTHITLLLKLTLNLCTVT